MLLVAPRIDCTQTQDADPLDCHRNFCMWTNKSGTVFSGQANSERWSGRSLHLRGSDLPHDPEQEDQSQMRLFTSFEATAGIPW